MVIDLFIDVVEVVKVKGVFIYVVVVGDLI